MGTELISSQLMDSLVQYYKAQENKDITVIENLFTDDSFIVSGIAKQNFDGTNRLPDQIQCLKKPKREYLAGVERGFLKVSSIKVNINKIELEKHPYNSNLIGVIIHKETESDGYKATGQEFLIWDINNPQESRILARLWLPDGYMNDNSSQLLSLKADIYNRIQ